MRYERRVCAAPESVNEQDAVAAIEFFIDGHERWVGRGLAYDRSSDGCSDHAELSKRAVEFFERFVYVRERQGRECLESFRPAAHHVRVKIVRFSRRGNCVRFV